MPWPGWLARARSFPATLQASAGLMGRRVNVARAMARHAESCGAVVRTLRPELKRQIGIVHRRGVLSPAATAMIEATTLAEQTASGNHFRAQRTTFG